jgi:endonuclease YncB( thermonuclease family)
MAWIARIIASLLGLAVLLFFVVRPWEAEPGGHDTPPVAPAPAAPPQPAKTEPASSSMTEAPAPDTPARTALTAPKPAEPNPGEPEPHLLTHEQAEQDRFAHLEGGHAIAPGSRPQKTYYRVKVRDGATLEAASASAGSVGPGPPATGADPRGADVADSPGTAVSEPEPPPCVIHLEGIAVREVESSCLDQDGLAWPCGARARAALTKFIHARAVTCMLPPTGETADFTAPCSVGGADLSLWMVRQGWAEPKPAAERALAGALKTAKDAHLGIWHGREE